jgi:hypothetical protein
MRRIVRRAGAPARERSGRTIGQPWCPIGRCLRRPSWFNLALPSGVPDA